MDKDRFATIKRILAGAIGREPDERARYLDEACRGDADLRAEVEAKLRHEDRGLPVLETGGLTDLITGADPESIGGYRILGRIGVGGMGTVYAAEQQSPRRTVALKVVRPGLFSPKLLRRFQHEAQLLGRLQHPGIAQILEAGTFDSGAGPQPFFVMERIVGEPLGAYCDGRGLDHRARLGVVARVCDAVHHAHERGVIHRDLKPGNILVVPGETVESAQPKVLDFGIARATDADIAQTTWHTETGQLIGTLPYMSPEQAAGDLGSLDPRSDVYALGVIAFELLAGKLPYEIPGTMLEAVRTIREQEPSSLRTVDRSLRGDVETIVGKALAKEREQRYASAAEMAADIRRYLRDEPIAARPPSTAYRIGKFARRNRGLVAGVVSVFVVLLAGVVTSITFALRARERASEASAISEFLRDDLLSAVAPSAAAGRGRDVAMKEVLDVAAARIEKATTPGGRFAERPLVEAAIRRTLGDTYRQLGELEAAAPHLEGAYAIRQRKLGADDPLTTESQNDLAILRYRQGRFDEAEALYRDALARRVRTLGPDHKGTLGTLGNLGLLLEKRGRYEEAETILHDLQERATRVLGRDDPTTLLALNNLAVVYDQQGRLDEAGPLYLESLERHERALGEEAPETLMCRTNLAILRIKQGRRAEADTLLSETLTLQERIVGRAHAWTIDTMINLAILRKEDGQVESALPLELDALERCRVAMGEEHPLTLRVLNNLGSTYTNLDRLDDAEPVIVGTLQARRRVLGENHPETFITLSNYCELLILRRRFDEAEAETRAYYERAVEVFGEEHSEPEYAIELLARLYDESGRPALADSWRKKLRSAGDEAGEAAPEAPASS